MTDDLKARFERMYTGAVADVLDAHGHRDQILPAGILPVRLDMKVDGTACLTSAPPATLTARVISVVGDAKADCAEKRASANANIDAPTHCEKLDLFIIITPPKF